MCPVFYLSLFPSLILCVTLVPCRFPNVNTPFSPFSGTNTSWSFPLVGFCEHASQRMTDLDRVYSGGEIHRASDGLGTQWKNTFVFDQAVVELDIAIHDWIAALEAMVETDLTRSDSDEDDASNACIRESARRVHGRLPNLATVVPLSMLPIVSPVLALLFKHEGTRNFSLAYILPLLSSLFGHGAFYFFGKQLKDVLLHIVETSDTVPETYVPALYQGFGGEHFCRALLPTLFRQLTRRTSDGRERAASKLEVTLKPVTGDILDVEKRNNPSKKSNNYLCPMRKSLLALATHMPDPIALNRLLRPLCERLWAMRKTKLLLDRFFRTMHALAALLGPEASAYEVIPLLLRVVDASSGASTDVRRMALAVIQSFYPIAP